jgi:hypothetical protein
LKHFYKYVALRGFIRRPAYCRIVKHLGQSIFKEVDRRKIAERPHRDRIGTAEMDSKLGGEIPERIKAAA